MQFVITLVHGTGAQHAPWTQDGPSELRRSLANALGSPGNPVIFRPFEWSGSNSFGARSGAARDLRTFLKDGLAQFPTAKHAIVAHSHGGNVVLYALRDDTVAAPIDSVICLSTPFFATQERKFGPYSEVIVGFSVVIFSVTVGLIVAIAVSSVLITSSNWAVLYLIVTILVGWLTWSMVKALGRLWYRHAKDWSADVNATTPNSKTRLLVIRPIADEASEALTALHAPSILMVRAWRGLAWLLTQPLIIASRLDMWGRKRWHRRLVVCGCTWALVMWWTIYKYPWATRDQIVPFAILLGVSLFGASIFSRDLELLKLIGFVLAPITLILGLVFLALLFFLSLFTLPHNLPAKDFLSFVATAIWLGPIDVTVEQIPAGSNYQSERLPEDAESGLRHSSTYEHPLAIQHIIDWIGASR